MVRAKFRVTEINHYPDNASHIKLSAVYDDDPNSENGKFFKYTPAGEIDLQVVNTDAIAEFKAGEEYYVDFTPVKAGKSFLHE